MHGLREDDNDDDPHAPPDRHACDSQRRPRILPIVHGPGGGRAPHGRG
ncbi:hypothetical protein SDC9_208133 [bioreactor metagenome]|uniref:Uncharacterized protein n=1 Tax=bioreactor metagenome TaxID=1076179 RepID=A0A645J9P5_9ZZZZ